MKKTVAKIIPLISKIIGKRRIEKLLIYVLKTIDVNLHIHGLIQIGVLNGFDQQVNGEDWLINNFLISMLANTDKPILFDVGANVGNYTTALNSCFPNAHIYAFEPVENTFAMLSDNMFKKNIKIYNIGLSDKTGLGELYNTVNETNTEIASVYIDVFANIFKNKGELSSIKFQMDTIDNFCSNEQIQDIDFIKIDVEGHELSVLKGASQAIRNDKIKIIQFEFNTHNTYSKVFLRDFYSLLPNFEFYRLHKKCLISLGEYNSVNEIFTAQNIVAIHINMKNKLEKKWLKRYE